MLELLLAIFNIITPVMLCVAVGYFWNKRGLPFDTKSITMLVVNIGTPCLLLANLSSVEMDGGILFKMMLAAILGHILCGVCGWLILKNRRLPINTYLSSMVFNNTGNLGLSLCLLAFGKEGLALGLAYMSMNTIGLFTLGPWFSSGSSSPSKILKTPAVYAVALALTLLYSGHKLPGFLFNFCDIVGGLVIPLMLFALGGALAKLRIKRLRTPLTLALAKVAVGLAVGIGVSWLLGMEGTSRSVFILECLLPVAIFNYLWAERYDNGPEEVASLIIVSTLLALLVVPITLAVLL